MDYQFQQFLGLLSDPESVKRMQNEARLRANDYERMAYQKYGEDRGSVQLNGNMVAIPMALLAVEEYLAQYRLPKSNA